MTAKRSKKRKLQTAIQVRAALPNPRVVAALEGVLDAVEEETPEEIKQYAPMVRAGLAVLLGVGSQGGKSFGVDTGGGVAVLVRPVDARAVAVRAFNELVADLIPEVTRRGAKAAFKKKLGKKT